MSSARLQSKPKSSIQPAVPQPQDFPPLAAPADQPTASKEKATPPNVSASSFKPAIPALGKTTNRDAGSRRDTLVTQTAQKNSDVPKVPLITGHPGELKDIATQETDTLSSTKDADDATTTRAESETATKSEGTTSVLKNVKQDEVARTKKAPGILDISATKNVVRPTNSASTAGPVKLSESSTKLSMTSPTASQPATPTRALTHSAPSSATRGQPRSFRIAEMPRTDPPLKSASPVTGEPATIPSNAISRRSSLVSAQAPGTPVSERISDNVSMPSTVLSRASSPGPASKVGSAPVRQVSKNQRKKERQAQAKQIEVESRLGKTEEEVVKEQKEEVVQAPIQGRKKKTKKVNTGGTTTSTPAVTRPSSPSTRPTADDVPEVPTTPALESINSTPTAVTQIKTSQPSAAAPPSETRPVTEPKPTMSLLTAFEKADHILPKLFKPLPFSGKNLKFTQDEILSGKPRTISPDDISNAQKEDHPQAKPVIVQLKANEGDPTGHWVILLPDGRQIWEHSQDMAERYVQLHERLRNKDDHLAFTPDPTKLPGKAELERWVPRIKTTTTTSAATARNVQGEGKKGTSTRVGVGNVEFTYDEELSPTSSVEDLPVISHWVTEQEPIPSSGIPPATHTSNTDGFLHNADPNSPTHSSFHRGFSFIVPLDGANAIAAAAAAAVNNDMGSSGFRGMKPEDLKKELEDMERMLEIRRKEEALAVKMLGASIKKNRKISGS